ncbi:MAG: hemagglutinin repeat-containing protein, partial [Sebaldella sp.]|nr:hemagglutinin repeat-containing protein [Sebaldella sp.]
RGLIGTSRDYNIADSVSVIEGNNVVIQGTPTISNGYVIQSGVTVDPSTITTKDVDVNLYYDPVTIHVDNTEIAAVVRDGVIPFNTNMFNDTVSKLFTQSKDPSSKYLIETRSQYIDLNKFFGSDYFLSRLGYNEANEWNLARRLGDSYYETKYLNTVIFETLGTRFINGKTDTALIKDLLDNGVETSKNLQLSLGVELTKEQVAALKSDIIWYVEKEVNGEKVLVPQVYLSQTTLSTMKNPTTTISAQETLAINSGDLLNQGRIEGKSVYVNANNVINKSVGELRAEILGDNISINSSKDILNIGATIGAKENLNLIATGDIVNITTGDKTKVTDSLNGKKRTYEADSIQSTGLISAGENTVISGNNYISRGAITESGDTTYIQADNEVKISTINLKESQTEKIKYGHESYEINQKIGSEVTGVGNVVIDAKNINIKGSSVMSDGTVQMTAENDINIVNDKDTMYTETIKKKNGTFSKYSLEEKDYKEGAVASTIVGNNVILEAGNNINVRASNIVAVKDGIENTGGNIVATAGNDINISADTLNNEYSRKEKSSGFSTNFSSGGGGLSASISYNKNSLEQTSNNTVVAVSSLMSEGSTVLDAGNRIRTEAMQANVGEDLIIRGINGVELLDAKETYEEKTKQKSSSIGITASVGSTVTSFISSADDVLNNNGKYGFDNKSQLINSYGDGLGLYRDTVKAGADLSQAVVDGMKGTIGNISKPSDLAGYGVSANVSLNVSQSKYESNTSGTRSVAGVINVGGNMIVESEGDVRFVNQKINVGDNLIIDAKSFEALAGKNTYTNDTKSSSSGASVGYDVIGNTVTGGINGSKGNSNTTSTSYDNTVINAGGTFQLVTKEDATFKGANVTADKINFDIGGNLNVVSLQDEYYTHGKNASAGINYGHNDVRNAANEMEGYNSVGGDMSYGQTNGDAKWVNDQTSIIATNGGKIKVEDTLTNIGAIIGSINEPLNIDTKKLVTEDLKDYNNSENYNIGLSGMDRKNAVPETAIQYGSENKEQDTNATFSNVVVTENGTKVDLEDRGINTDIEKAQVVTKDEKVDQIDTKLGTDLINKNKRDELINDMVQFGKLPGEIIKAGKEIITKLNSGNSEDIAEALEDLKKQQGISGDVNLIVIDVDKTRNDKNNFTDGITSYTGSDKVLYGVDSNGNKIYAKDKSGETGNYLVYGGENTFYFIKDSDGKLSNEFDPYSGKVFTNANSADFDGLNNYNTISSDPKVNLEVGYLVYMVTVYDKAGNQKEVYDYTPGVLGLEAGVDIGLAAVYLPNGAVIKKASHLHSAADGYFGTPDPTSPLSSGALTKIKFPNYNSEYFSPTDLDSGRTTGFSMTVGTPGDYNYFKGSYEMVPSGFTFNPSTNKLEFLGNIKDFRDYNKNNWILDTNGSPIIRDNELNIIKLKK